MLGGSRDELQKMIDRGKFHAGLAAPALAIEPARVEYSDDFTMETAEGAFKERLNTPPNPRDCAA
jgi:hypothetical protein